VEALEHANRSGDQHAIAVALVSRVNGAWDFDHAARHAPAAIRQLRAVGDIEHIAVVGSNVGWLAIAEERYHEALQWLDEGLTAADEWGGGDMPCVIRGSQGIAWLFLGELAHAARKLDEALELCIEAGRDDEVEELLLAAAALGAADSDFPRAARLAGAAERHRAGIRPAGEQNVLDRLRAPLERARTRADPAEWEHAEREGAQLDLNEAIAAARSGLTAARQTSSAAEPADA
jgi:tetratricopeptide (TPR) repeat protein